MKKRLVDVADSHVESTSLDSDSIKIELCLWDDRKLSITFYDWIRFQSESAIYNIDLYSFDLIDDKSYLMDRLKSSYEDVQLLTKAAEEYKLVRLFDGIEDQPLLEIIAKSIEISEPFR